MLLFHRLGMAQKAGDPAQAGSQDPFHSVLGRQGRELFFISISDYYLTIIEIFSGEAHCPGQPLESPNPREPGSITRLPGLPPPSLTWSSRCSAILRSFAYYFPIIRLWYGYVLRMRCT